MTTLIDLPEEIIAHICSSFYELEVSEVNPLSSLSRCCWKLRRIAEDPLYHTINIYATSSEQSLLPLLIRTLLARATLAAKIKKLVISANTFVDKQDDFGELDEVPLTYDYGDPVFEKDTLVAACVEKIVEDKVYDPARTFWIIGLAQKNVTSFVGFLFTLRPNLIELYLDIGHKESQWGRAEQVLESLFLSGPYRRAINPTSIRPLVDFSKVRRLDTNGLNLEILALDFPSLEELVLNLVEGGEEHGWGAEAFTCNIIRSSKIIPPYPQLRTLRLHTDWEDLETHLHASRCTAAVFDVVRCYNLVTVEFRLEHGPRNSGDNRLGSWNTVMEDLQAVHGTIESLTLDVVRDRHWFFDLSRLSQFDPIESLHHFSSLRKLTLPQSALLSDKDLIGSAVNPSAFFPPSLQDITVKGPTGKIIGWLENVALAKSSGTLDVNKVLIICDEDDEMPASWFRDRVPASTWDDVRNAGIEVQVVDDPERIKRSPRTD